MALDILAVIMVVALAAWGFRKGALAQVLQIIAVVLALFAARPVGGVISVLLYGETPTGEPFLDLGLVAVGGLAVFGLMTGVGFLIERSVRDEDEDPSTIDRSGGAVLGLVKGVLVVYLATAGVLSIEGALEKADPEDRLQLRTSVALTVARILPRPWDFAPRKDKGNEEEGRLEKADRG